MIRDANFVDIPAIVELLQDAFTRTHYAQSRLGEIDEDAAKELLVHALQNHRGTLGGSYFVQVAEKNGKLTGLIVGQLVRVYQIGNRLMVTDLFWIASPDVDPQDPPRLMKNMLEWAKACDYVVEAICATTGIIAIDPRKAGRILERLGMKEYGTVYRLEFAA